MTLTAIIPPTTRAAADSLKLSPAILSSGHVFLSGTTGADENGVMPDDPETQFRNIFEKISLVLQEANLTMAAIVEMTTYHVGLREHFDLFSNVRAEFVTPPYPAWTAIEVAGLRRQGAIVEIRVIAAT